MVCDDTLCTYVRRCVFEGIALNDFHYIRMYVCTYLVCACLLSTLSDAGSALGEPSMTWSSTLPRMEGRQL